MNKLLIVSLLPISLGLFSCSDTTEKPKKNKVDNTAITVPDYSDNTVDDSVEMSSSNNVETIDDSDYYNKCMNELQGSKLQVESIRVIDGDTVEILPQSGQSERVRLLGIDAPESSQEYGAQSTQTLQSCVLSSPNIYIQWTKKDSYERLLGKVMAGDRDCNLNQVLQGSAWHYKQYQKSQSELDRVLYSNAELYARTSQLGLWQPSSIAIAPWDYRRNLMNPNYYFNEKRFSVKDAVCGTGSIDTGRTKAISY